METLVIFVLAGIGGFFAVTSFGRGEGGDQASRVGIDQARCVRQFDGLEASDSQAEAICGCMLEEFDKRGIAMLDAFKGRADEMQDITRSCAEDEGYIIAG